MYVSGLWWLRKKAGVVRAIGRGERSGNKHLLNLLNVPGAKLGTLLGYQFTTVLGGM